MHLRLDIMDDKRQGHAKRAIDTYIYIYRLAIDIYLVNSVMWQVFGLKDQALQCIAII